MGLSTWLIRLASGAGAVVGVAVALLYIFQEKILYVPVLPGIPANFAYEPERYGLDAEDIEITARDGIKLHAWLLKLKHWGLRDLTNRPVILFFQENAGNMSFRLPFLRLMAQRLDCPILAVSYRGYFLSKGRPTEKGLMKDAQAALDYLASRTHDINGKNVVVYGRSLGGAVAIHLVAANQDKVRALVVENTFTSVEDMVSRVVPPLGFVVGQGKPFNFLVTNKWHNRDKIKDIRLPILMLVSERDEMVPAEQMYTLNSHITSMGHQLVVIPGARHMDAYDAQPDLYWSSYKEFMDKYVDAPAVPSGKRLADTPSDARPAAKAAAEAALARASVHKASDAAPETAPTRAMPQTATAGGVQAEGSSAQSPEDQFEFVSKPNSDAEL